jgi:asparagine synthase (glutamine-hydrolysing)
MCGIWGYLTKSKLSNEEMIMAYKKFNEIRPRGPDRFKLFNLESINMLLGFHRLSIIDTSHKGDQPFLHIENNRTVYTLCNGEIYNYKQLIDKHNLNPLLKQESDCNVVHELYLKLGLDALCHELIGEFAFMILDMNGDDTSIHIARDPLGVRPLYVSYDNQSLYIGSELKGSPHAPAPTRATETPIIPTTTRATETPIIPITPKTTMPFVPKVMIEQVRGGHYASFNLSDPSFKPIYHCYYSVDTVKPIVTDISIAKDIINKSLSECVIDRLMADVPIGFLLSGGVDSSLICGIAANHLKPQRIRTFSCGLETGSTDEPYAKKVAEHINSIHTHIVFTEKEFIEAIPNIVYIIETYDITSVRASVAQYLICKWIKTNTDIKVLFCGDGSDELTKGYKYNHMAPNVEEAHKDTLRLLKDIIYFDGKRADRGIAGNGLEGRVPFLDYRFVNTYLSIEPSLTMPTIYEKTGKKLEKWLLRESFRESNIIPEEVLFRNKEAFSDGISTIKKSWFETVQDEMNERYKNVDITEIGSVYSYNTPPTREALYYREEFERQFGKDAITVIPYFWLPKWVGAINEPSARILEAYK